MADTVAPLVLTPAQAASALAMRRSKPFQRVQSVVTLQRWGPPPVAGSRRRLAARRRCGMAQVTAQLKERFLAAVGHSGNVTHAATTVGLSRRHVYRVRAADPAFAAAWYDAVESYADLLEAEADRRAVEGVVKPLFYKGQRLPVELREYSDVLLMFRLKALRPEKYRERCPGAHHGPKRGPLQIHLVHYAEP
jgi:hypothetical protein